MRKAQGNSREQYQQVGENQRIFYTAAEHKSILQTSRLNLHFLSEVTALPDKGQVFASKYQDSLTLVVLSIGEITAHILA